MLNYNRFFNIHANFFICVKFHTLQKKFNAIVSYCEQFMHRKQYTENGGVSVILMVAAVLSHRIKSPTENNFCLNKKEFYASRNDPMIQFYPGLNSFCKKYKIY